MFDTYIEMKLNWIKKVMSSKGWVIVLVAEVIYKPIVTIYGGGFSPVWLSIMAFLWYAVVSVYFVILIYAIICIKFCIHQKI